MPAGVVIVAILLLIGGIFSLLWGLLAVGVGGVSFLAGTLTFADSVQAWGGSALFGGLLHLATGLAQVVAGLGLLARQYWARLLAIATMVVFLIGPILSLFHGNVWSIFLLIVPGVILLVLLSPEARTFFQPGATGR